jgi:Tfp pilus assembly protein PilF
MKAMAVWGGMVLLVMGILVGCESKKDEPQQTGEQGTPGAKAVGADTAIMGPVASPGRIQNDEGVGHYQQGHWDVADEHFRKAIEADPNLAEAHFNLALALDKQGKHEDATRHFKKAAELAPANVQIAESPILKKHTGM